MRKLMHAYDACVWWEKEHEEVDSDSIRCLSLVSMSDVVPKVFVSENQGKVTFLDFVFSFLCV